METKDFNMSTWTSLSYSSNAAFGDRIFVNIPWRAHSDRSNKLTAWIIPIVGHEDVPGAWRFRAKSGQNDLADEQTADLLAGVFTLLAAHGYKPEALSFSTLAALAQRPQHHISAEQREAAKRHIQRQRSGKLNTLASPTASLTE